MDGDLTKYTVNNQTDYIGPVIAVEGQEHGPIEVAISAAFLFCRYKFLSQAKDKNLYRLPKLTRTCSDYRLDGYLNNKLKT